MTERERQQAIADMRFARQTHVEWAEWIEGNPDAAAAPPAEPTTDIAGDAKHHRDWVEKYDRVLSLLEG